MKKQLENQIEFLEKKVNGCTEQLTKDFCHELPWVGEDLYISSYKLQQYKFILLDFNEWSKTPEHEIINNWIKKYTTFISRPYNVRENSTGSLFRECSTWKFMCSMELLEELKNLIVNE